MPAHRPASRSLLRQHVLSLAVTSALALSACGGGDDAPASQDPPPPPATATQVRGIVFETHTLASAAHPAGTPGSPGATVAAGSKIATQFGTTSVDLNNVRYTRYQASTRWNRQPDAVLIAVPGTLAGSHSYLVLAENLIQRMWTDHALVVELWGVDRRSMQLQDMAGLNVAERARDASVALNWLYGDELGLPLSPQLATLNRRAVFYDQNELGFFGNWTPQVHSIDIDAIVERARTVARNGNVFLGGHSAGTGFVARYAATDFDFTNAGTSNPGYAKLKGLVLFEGAGTSLAATAPTEAQLDAVVAAADGGLAAAITAGTVSAYTAAPTLTPRVNASTEVNGMQIAFEGTINGSQSLLQRDQGGIAGNNVYSRVPGFSNRAFTVTAGSALGTFMDDDNLATTVFYSISMGALGEPSDPANPASLRPWIDNNGVLPSSVFRDRGAMAGIASPWGVEVEPTNLMRFTPAFFAGNSTYSDWYYPSSGLTIGNAAGSGGANLGLDTSALSLPVARGGRGRSDIVNQTQARNINVPVIAFGGSNGLTPTPGIWRGFASAIGACTAPTCTAGTARTTSLAVEPITTANRSYGNVAGGFEVHISEGYTHVDILTANDDATNKVVRPLSDFIARNAQR
ncbi:MAG: hypothetical protein ABW190_12940 [Rhizobacter sp.]